MVPAKEVMTTPAITVIPKTTIKELSEMFVRHKVNGFPVVDDDGLLSGIVTEKNLIEQNKNLHIPTVIALFDAVIYLESNKKFEEELKRYNASTVADIYTKNVVTVEPDTPINEVATLMAEKGVHSIPVVEGRKILGILGKLDVIKALSRS
ncbi:MAG: CBS domain-containing protein [Nitrospinaceae bacterium]|nr:CBS domain-containing protein [Nitrospinaceae bacterium]NIR56084.1 CBS domain-containing protein [Nitrospinaceae bacterium]NIS86532.1 CBS domain-containing protein [Nitrospinaceae bacterium]NIT83366.1 CBS domain-containing protein [Nitrospinaceae bacterium]NIU45576.1 CBS domain-containing protein [Nitrospinaceae bacterium]